MARKRGLVGLVLASIMAFLAGSVTVMVASYMLSKLGIDPQGSWIGQALQGGLVSMLGFLYRFLVGKLLMKSSKKLLAG